GAGAVAGRLVRGPPAQPGQRHLRGVRPGHRAAVVAVSGLNGDPAGGRAERGPGPAAVAPEPGTPAPGRARRAGPGGPGPPGGAAAPPAGREQLRRRRRGAPETRAPSERVVADPVEGDLAADLGRAVGGGAGPQPGAGA